MTAAADDWRRYLPQAGAVPSADAGAAEVDWQKYLPQKPGYIESALRGLKQGATFGFGDEITGALESALTSKTYKQARDEARANDAAAAEANPLTYGAGEIGGGLATTLATGGAAGGALAGLKGAALAGAAYGAGSSDADLTEGDVGGLARDTAIGAGVGALAHGAAAGISKAAKAVAPKARAALEMYAISPTEDVLAGAAKSAGGRALLGAGAGLYSGDEDRVESALKGAVLGIAGPALLKGATKAAKSAILLALKRGGVAAAEKAAAEHAPAVAERLIEREATPAAGTALATIPREEAMAQVVSAAKAGALTPELADQAVLSGVPESAVKRLQDVSQRLAIEAPEYTPPGAAHVLEGEPERLALAPVPEAPPTAAEPPAAPKVKLGTRTVAPDELADVRWDGKPLGESGVDLRVMREAPDLGAVRDAKTRPVTIAVSPDGRQEVVDGRHRILVARERGEPLKVKFVRGAKGLDEAPAVAEATAAGPDPRAAAIEEFKAAVAKAKRLEASGDKLRAKTWLAAAERDFKAAMKGAK